MKENAIIYSVFHDNEYIKLLALSLKSLNAAKAVDFTTTDIIIYAEDVFELEIRGALKDACIDDTAFIIQLLPYRPPLHAACYKFLVLTNEVLSQYKRFLYLDADTLIAAPLQHLFEVPLEDRLYVAKYGDLDDPVFNGGLFKQEEKDCLGVNSTFTGSVLLFIRGPSVQTLFNNTMMHVRHNGFKSIGNNSFAELPFLLYQAFRRDCIDTEVLTPFVSHAAAAAAAATAGPIAAINHFFGHPGCAWYKRLQMQEFAAKHGLFNESPCNTP